MLKEPSYYIRPLEDQDGDGVFGKSALFTDSIPLPMGGSFIRAAYILLRRRC